MPVLPEVGSRIVCPGPMSPRSSASSMSARATRSLTEPVGLNDSILAHRRTPALARGALRDRELAEAGEADLVTARQLVGDLPERRLDGLFGLTAAQPGLLGDRLCELGLVDGAHDGSSWDGNDGDRIRRPGRKN